MLVRVDRRGVIFLESWAGSGPGRVGVGYGFGKAKRRKSFYNARQHHVCLLV